MVNYHDVIGVDPNAYAEEARNWQRLADGLRDRGMDLEQQIRMLDGWTGAAADQAKATLTGHRGKYADASAILAKVPLVLEEAAARFGRAKAEAVRLDDRASKALWIITADGEVVSRYGGSVDPMEPTYPVAKELEVSARALIQEVARADADTAAALRELSAQSAGLAPPDQATVAAAATTIPARGSAPADVRKWWDSLTPMQQESLLYTHAAEIGALDGVPAADRDRANRSHLAELKGRLDAEKQHLDAKGDYRTDEETDRLAALNEKLGGISDIEQRLSNSDKTKPAFLLGIDSQGNGRAIVAIGNPDTAANIATFVPGTESRLGRAAESMSRAELMADAADNAGSPSTAAIAWVGYDAPQNIIPEAADSSYADNAKKDLNRFQDGLRATHEGGPSHNVVIGHSYGSTVIGHTAGSEGLNADAVVLVGSPGVGTGVTNVGQLNFPPDQVYATVADNDIIHQTNNPDSFGDPIAVAMDPHGADPADPHFGARVFVSDPGTDGGPFGSVAAHGEYWRRNSSSLRNMGLIIAGSPPAVR